MTIVIGVRILSPISRLKGGTALNHIFLKKVFKKKDMFWPIPVAVLWSDQEMRTDTCTSCANAVLALFTRQVEASQK